MNDSWIKETKELLEAWESKRVHLEIDIDKMQEQLEELDRKIVTGYALMQAYIDKHNITSLPLEGVRPGYFGNKTYPEMLIEIAQGKQGYLKVVDAVEIMLEANVSTDRRLIQANIYSALRRMRKRFVKMARGEYRYTNHAPPQSEGEPSGVKQAVRELREKNPVMTKQGALKTLLQKGFDFKGKNPQRAVHMAWVSLGYHKNEPRQQSLIESLS